MARCRLKRQDQTLRGALWRFGEWFDWHLAALSDTRRGDIYIIKTTCAKWCQIRAQLSCGKHGPTYGLRSRTRTRSECVWAAISGRIKAPNLRGWTTLSTPRSKSDCLAEVCKHFVRSTEMCGNRSEMLQFPLPFLWCSIQAKCGHSLIFDLNAIDKFNICYDVYYFFCKL